MAGTEPVEPRWHDVDLEKLYAYARLLRRKLPWRDDGGILDLDDDVDLTYYRLTKTGEHDARLEAGEIEPVTGADEVGTREAVAHESQSGSLREGKVMLAPNGVP